MELGRIRKRAADLLTRVFHRHKRTAMDQLAQEIAEYGRMNAIGPPGDILVEVPEVAFRLRESLRDVRQALHLLEARGIAKRTNFKDYWKLRDHD